MNRIIEIKLTLESASWMIEVTKEFAPEHGGGTHVFTEYGGIEVHEALRRAAMMVTLTPANRVDAERREVERSRPSAGHEGSRASGDREPLPVCPPAPEEAR